MVFGDVDDDGIADVDDEVDCDDGVVVLSRGGIKPKRCATVAVCDCGGVNGWFLQARRQSGR